MTISPTTVRKNGESLRGYVAVFRGAQILIATVTANAGVKSAKTLSISITVGSISDVQRGYRVQVFSSGGAFKGETHVRWGGTLDSTHLPVREFSESEFLILSTDVVKVFALIAFADRLIEDTDLFDPDGVPVGTYNSAPRPLACSGGYDAGFVDGYESGTVQTYRTVITDGSNSRVMDPTSNLTHKTHLWTLVTGVAFAPGSGSTDVSPTLRVNQGEYTIYHDVTDTDNGTTWRQCVTYQVFDATHLPVGVIMETAPTGDPEQGWSCTFRAVDFLSLTDAPDGSLVVFFVRERINETWQSLGGSTGRSAIKLLGYLSHDESDLTPQLQLQRFQVISPLQRLGQLPGFSKILITNNTPNDWSKMLDLSTLRAKVELARIYTFAFDGGHDLLISFFYTDYGYPELWLQKETPLQQIRELADGCDARLSCTRNGLFRIDPILPLLDPALRVALFPVYTFGRQDVIRLVARRDHFDTIETLELHATTAGNSGNLNDNAPVFSRAPGSPGHGAEFTTIERIIANNGRAQADANERAGRRYAWRNGVYTNSTTGVKARAPEIDVEMRLVYDFLDFDDQIVLFDSFPNPRDVDLTFFQWTLTKVSLDYASGKVVSTFSPLTDSPPGATYIPPASPAPPVVTPPAQLPIYGTPPPGTTYGLPSATGNIALFDETHSAEWTGDLRLASPVWTDTDLTLLSGWAGTLMMFILDAFATANGVVITSTKAFQLLAFGSSSISLASAYSFRFTPALRAMQSERATKGFFVVVSYQQAVDGGNGTDIDVTQDSGATWTRYTSVFGTWVGGGGDGSSPGCFVSAHTPGKVLTSGYLSAGVTDGGIYVSTNSGATWTRLNASHFYGLAYDIHIPFQDIAESTVYHGGADGSSGHQSFKLFKSTSTSQTDISPMSGGESYGPSAQFGVKTCDVDARSVLCVGQNWDDGHTLKWGVFLSRDGGITWNAIIAPDTTVLYRSGCFAGDSPNTIFLWGLAGAFAVSYDGGVTWQDKSVSGGGTIANIAGYSA